MAGKLHPKQLAQSAAREGQVMIWSAAAPNQWVPGSFIANWVGTRYYAVDYDGGNDENIGFSDVSMAAAGVVALKTLERLRLIFPRFGNGQKAVIAVKSRAAGASYRNIANSADDELHLVGITGYQHVLVRGTGTQATAGAVAFANDAADKVFCGAQVFTGTNAAGYEPIGVPTVSVVQCRLFGGGAAALSAEPTLIGKRIRFDSATATVSLRNVCRMIWQNTTDTITVEADLPAVPALTDVFYIEEPAVSVDRIQIHGYQGSTQAFLPSFSTNGLSIVGFRMPNTTASFVPFAARNVDATFQVAFCDAYTPGTSSCTWGQITNPSISASYTDETNTSIRPGVGMATNAWGGTLTSCLSLIISSSACRAGRWQIINIAGGLSVGAGCAFLGAGLLFQNCKGSGGTQDSVGGNTVGNGASATTRRLRLTGGFSTACLALTNMDSFLRGIDIQNAGALTMIEVRGLASVCVVNDVVGSTGNTGVGLDLSLNRDSCLVMGQLNANTFTGAAGQDIRGAGPVFYTHADYARTDLLDRFNNSIQGSTSTELGTTAYLANDATANIGQYAALRMGTGTAVRTAQADSAANAAAVVAVSQHSFTTAQSCISVDSGSTWLQFDSAPSVGNIAYLSTATAGNAQVAIPAVAGTNQKLRLGRVLAVSGTLGLVSWRPDNLPILADGLA